MSVIDEVLAANEIYSRTHELRKLTPRPERKLAVLTCMDTRLSIRTLGLKTGDAHVIRNAGGIVTEDVIRSLLVSHFLLGTEEIMVINHTDCGLMHTSEEGLRTRIQTRAGTAAVAPASFHTFQDVEENVRHQMQKLRAHPWIPESVGVRGFVYDVINGRLSRNQGCLTFRDISKLSDCHVPQNRRAAPIGAAFLTEDRLFRG
jgi:carbonic anhydrase